MCIRDRGYGAAASLVSVLVYNFFFTVPRFTLLAYDPGYPLTFAVMLAASLVTSSLTLRVKRDVYKRQEWHSTFTSFTET